MRSPFTPLFSCHLLLCLAAAPLLGCPPDPVQGSGTEGATTGDSDDAQPTPTTGEAPACEAEWEAARTILDAHCAGCHGPDSGNIFSIVLDPKAMLQHPKGYLKASDPEGSKVYQKVVTGEMPKNAAPLADADKQALKSYIECLEPQDADPLAAPGCDPGRHLTHAAALALMRTDILGLPQEARPHTRYLSLAHLRNAGHCDGVVATYKQALDKLLNSLSTKNALNPLAAVDGSAGLLLRVDLRDYDVDAGLWHEIACANPFVVDFTGNPQLDDDAVAIRDQSLEPLFVQPGDAFLHLTSQRTFYNKILGLPATRQEFEQKFKINLAGALATELVDDEDLLVRAGMLESGVAEFNRVIEWHDLPGDSDGFCWVSYDFTSNSGKENILEHPLDFHDHANEIICSLPNGLQFYYISIKGLRADVADPAVVKNNEHDGDLILNGVSCMGCHRDGMRMAADTLRPYYEDHVIGESLLKDQVRRVYAPKDVLDARLLANQKTFLDALAELAVPTAVKTTAGGSIEPIFGSDLAFNDAPLDIHAVAGALDIEAEQVLAIKLLVEGFAALELGSGTLDRTTFATAFPQAVEVLQLGDAAPLQSCGG